MQTDTIKCNINYTDKLNIYLGLTLTGKPVISAGKKEKNII